MNAYDEQNRRKWWNHRVSEELDAVTRVVHVVNSNSSNNKRIVFTILSTRDRSIVSSSNNITHVLITYSEWMFRLTAGKASGHSQRPMEKQYLRAGGDVVYITSAECKPIAGEWGQSPQWVKRQGPWSGGKSPQNSWHLNIWCQKQDLNWKDKFS